MLNKKATILSSFGELVTSAFYPAATHLYETGEIPFIRCVDCVKYPIISKLQDKLFERIPLSFFKEHSTIKKLSKNEIVVTKVGTPCFASIIYEQNFVALSRTVFGISKIHGINPFYLLIFLRSHYGFNQLLRQREQTIQFQLTLERVRNILIYEPSSSFQTKIEKLVKTAYAKLEQSKTLYTQAESLLLQELGLDNWQQPKEAVAIKNFSASFGATGRLDAEYYQPKYDKLYKLLHKTSRVKGWELLSLGSLSEPLKYGSSEKLEYLDKGVPFLRIADLEQNRFEPANLKYIYPQKAAKIEKQVKVKTGDVLISRSGTLGLAVVIPDTLNEAVFGSYFIRARLNQCILDSTYLALYMSSLVGKLQVEQANTGAVQTNLTIPVIESLQMICPPLKIQKKFVRKVHQSYTLKDESKRLLETAKHAVELAIEQGEYAAIALLNDYQSF